jgi:hypothetical protein
VVRRNRERLQERRENRQEGRELTYRRMKGGVEGSRKKGKDRQHEDRRDRMK